jgi:hypothetical protein
MFDTGDIVKINEPVIIRESQKKIESWRRGAETLLILSKDKRSERWGRYIVYNYQSGKRLKAGINYINKFYRIIYKGRR